MKAINKKTRCRNSSYYISKFRKDFNVSHGQCYTSTLDGAITVTCGPIQQSYRCNQ